MASKRRPYITVRKRAWLDAGGTRTPGIGLMRGRTVCAHLTPSDALALADQIVDMAEALETKEKDKK